MLRKQKRQQQQQLQNTSIRSLFLPLHHASFVCRVPQLHLRFKSTYLSSMSIRYVELTLTRSARVYSARHQRFKLKTITDRKATPFRSCQVGRGFLFPSILYLTESCPLKSVALEKSAVANNSLRAKHLADEDAKPVAGFGP